MPAPFLIAGPCAAENQTQVVETARQVVLLLGNTVIFRAGVWKPRTNPNTFQGVGEEALLWLQQVQKQTGMAVATEVATPEHIEQAMAAGIDYLWLGARTTANPILVQQLADTIARLPQNDTLRGVFVKNPVNEDVQLWLGDIERIERTGVPAMAIHRGCAHRPCWAMAHTFRLTRPDIPLLLDPSHLGGSAAKIMPLMHYARDLAFDGAMIETHLAPQDALSDAPQQITPLRLKNVMDTYPLPYGSTEQTELSWLRAEIDEIDDRLWDCIAMRMKVSERIGQWKKRYDIPPLQQSRFNEILEKRIEWAEQNQLPRTLVESIFRDIHAASLKRQE